MSLFNILSLFDIQRQLKRPRPICQGDWMEVALLGSFGLTSPQSAPWWCPSLTFRVSISPGETGNVHMEEATAGIAS